MKRLYLTLILLISIILCCILELNYIQYKTSYFCNQIEEIDKFMESDNLQNASEHFADLNSEWAKWSNIPELFIHHNNIDNVTEQFLKMKSSLKNDEEENYWESSYLAKQTIKHLLESEKPSIFNIL